MGGRHGDLKFVEIFGNGRLFELILFQELCERLTYGSITLGKFHVVTRQRKILVKLWLPWVQAKVKWRRYSMVSFDTFDGYIHPKVLDLPVGEGSLKKVWDRENVDKVGEWWYASVPNVWQGLAIDESIIKENLQRSNTLIPSLSSSWETCKANLQ